MNLSKLSMRLAILVIIAIFFSQCSEQHHDMDSGQKSDMSLSVFNENVGSKIPTEMALRWIERTGSIEGRKESYSLSYKKTFELMQREGSLGVALHHAINPDGKHNILAIAVLEGIPFWESPLIVNTTTGEVMSNRPARSWARAYTEENPHGIRYHFFGRLILEQTFPHDLRITSALNDLGNPQLLLSYYDAEAGTEEFFDESMPCPIFCDPTSLQ